jgi:hypothetical protein
LRTTQKKKSLSSSPQQWVSHDQAHKALNDSSYILGWFQWSTSCISLSLTSHQISLSLTHYGSSSRLQLLGYSPSISAFSLPVSTTIPDLTILEFNSWTTNLRKKSNFIRFKILERYKKLENRNYIIDWKENYIMIK